jgi:hypothetical protein
MPAAALFTVWPWGLHPVAVGGVALSAIALTAAARPPRPLWSGRVRGADVVIMAYTAVLGALMLRPVLRGSLAVKLGAVMSGEDIARHLGMFDTIRRLGGYVFMNTADPLVQAAIQDVHRTYPQGFHITAAVLDNFLTSSTTSPTVLDELSRFLLYDIGCYVFFGFTILWAASRVAGPAAGVLATAPLGALVLGYLFFGDGLPIYSRGFAPEILGNAFFAIFVALVARPLQRTGEQTLTVLALLVAIAFTYTFLLPIALPIAAMGAWTYRRRLLRRPLTVVVLTGAAAGCAAIPLFFGRPQGTLNMLLRPYGVDRVGFAPLIVLGTLLAALLLTRARPTHTVPHRWLTAGAVTAAVSVAAVIGAYQLISIGRTVYFFDKALHTVATTLLISTGLAAPALSRWLSSSRRSSAVLATAALVVTGLAAFGAFGPAANMQSPGRTYLHNAAANRASAAQTLQVVRKVPDPDGRTTLLAIGSPRTGYSGTLFVAVLQGDYGKTTYGYTYMGVKTRTPEDLVRIVTSHPAQRFQIITADPNSLAALNALAASRPDLGLEVVDAASIN